MLTTIEKFHFTHSRTVGFFTDIKTPTEIVEKNIGDIYETIYEYAVIEKVSEGLYPIAKDILWFEWSEKENKYKKINKPAELSFACNFSIG